MPTKPHSLPWVVIGGGNGGQFIGGSSRLMGYTVRLVEVVPETVAAIQSKAALTWKAWSGDLDELNSPPRWSPKLWPALEIIMIVTPATAHRDVAPELRSIFVGWPSGCSSTRERLAEPWSLKNCCETRMPCPDRDYGIGLAHLCLPQSSLCNGIYTHSVI